MKPKPKDAVILQQGWPEAGPFADMMRLTYQRHAAYAMAHGMEYWAVNAFIQPDLWPGGWGKIWLLRQLCDQHYEHIFWVDADAAIMDMECDLRSALPEGKLIGACEHWAEWFPSLDIPRHYNVGVLYLRNDPRTREFLDEWYAAYPGHPRWLDQGSFNEMVTGKYASIFASLDARWNATYRVNECERPCVQAWHGVMPEAKRFGMMSNLLRDDFLRFRV
jgi:hypothetical protein